MKRSIVLSIALLSLPTFGQGAYKCQQPDGTVKYQSARCPDRNGQRIFVQDNGAGGIAPADALPETAPSKPASASDDAGGLRAGEKEMLENARQRDEAAAQRRHEEEMQRQRSEVAKEAIQAEREHQARLRAQFCARWPSSCR